MVSSPYLVLSKFSVYLIYLYRLLISPLLRPHCRFYPTCSEYGIKVIEKFGILKGIYLIFKRLLKCHPFGIVEEDLVPKTLIQENTKMDSKHNFIVISLLFLSFLIWQTWESDHSILEKEDIVYENKNKNLESDIPNQTILNQKKNYKTIEARSDVLSLKINIVGGDIEQCDLLTYSKEPDSPTPFRILKTSPEFIYQAQSGLTGRDGPDNPRNYDRPFFSTDKKYYSLSREKNEIIIPMFYRTKDNIEYKKTFILKRGDFSIYVNYDIYNRSEKPIEITFFGQLKESIYLPKEKNENNKFTIHSYRGAAYSYDKKKYKKYSFKEIRKEQLNIESNNGWIAFLQQYFATAWMPLTEGKKIFYTKQLEDGKIAVIGFKSSPKTINSGDKCTLRSKLWIGPSIQEKMGESIKNLDLTVDYGWLWFISQPMLKLLKFIHKYVGNWGFSIIIITFIIRGLMYPLTKRQYKSMVKIHMLQPKLKEIKERIDRDKKKQSQEIINLYKSEKVNPFGGCFPLIIQMPIFLALYYMLSNSIELRHAHFLYWIHDLSSKDPYYVLPFLMGISMFLIQKTSPTAMIEKTQEKIVKFMPIFFTIFFLWFPSGLVLYYVINNLVTVLQQKIILIELEKSDLYRKNKKQ